MFCLFSKVKISVLEVRIIIHFQLFVIETEIWKEKLPKDLRTTYKSLLSINDLDKLNSLNSSENSDSSAVKPKRSHTSSSFSSRNRSERSKKSEFDKLEPINYSFITGLEP